MAAVNLELHGIFEWAKVFDFNRDKASWNADTDGECKITVILDDENTKLLRDAGCQKKMVADEAGRGTKVTLARPFKARNEWQGGPPPVVDASGNPWDVEMNGIIGNGSIGVVHVTVYETNTGRKGTRLEGVQVIDHVAYESESGGDYKPGPRFKDYSQSESKAAPSSASPTKKAVAEDSIPF